MNRNQKIIGFIFFLTAIIETTISCIAFDLLINTLGAGKLGFYLAYAALASIFAVLLLTYLAKNFSSLHQFLALHLMFGLCAALSLIIQNEIFQAKLVFISIVGLGGLIYFKNWSVATIFISPFESKRLFPWMGVAIQAGVFLGAALAIASFLGISNFHYFSIWLLLEIIVLGAAYYLIKKEKELKPIEENAEIVGKPVSLSQLFRYYKWVPRITLWVILWGFLLKSMHTLVGASFKNSGINLTALYGIITLVASLLCGLFSGFVYPRFLKWIRLSAILMASSIICFIIGGIYLAINSFVLAIIVALTFEIIDSSFIEISMSTEFGLYPYAHRDRIRLLSERLAIALGGAIVGLLFLFPREVFIPVLFGVFLIWIMVSANSRKSFIKEVIHFLKSPDFEERNNAIALYDELEHEKGYSRIIDLLVKQNHLPTSINILNTLSSLGTKKPAPVILKILDKKHPEPLKIAALHYFENLKINELDPFLQYQIFISLKNICYSQSSNILRSMAVKILVENGPIEMTVGFIMKALESKDDRMIANAIEGLRFVNYPGLTETLLPFLEHKTPRVRANAIITLWKYPEVKGAVNKALEKMLLSKKKEDVVSGVYVVGEMNDLSHLEFLKSKIDDPNKGLQRGVPIALLKLGNDEYFDKVVEIILGQDEKQAINMCYLSLRLDRRILNELIISCLYNSGKESREIALKRYSRCGGFCREQLELLSGKKQMYQSPR